MDLAPDFYIFSCNYSKSSKGSVETFSLIFIKYVKAWFAKQKNWYKKWCQLRQGPKISDKNVTWLISIQISIRDNIHVKFKNLLSFFVIFTVLIRVLLGNDAITVYIASDLNIWFHYFLNSNLCVCVCVCVCVCMCVCVSVCVCRERRGWRVGKFILQKLKTELKNL